MAITIDFDEKFKARPYQQEILNALDEGIRKLLIILPRRSGKDYTIWNYAYRKAVKERCFIYYALPTTVLARRVIWDGMDFEGNRFLDLIDPQLVISRNEQQMKINFWNGSILMVGGALDIDKSLIGTNPKLIIFSEFALMDNGGSAFSLVRPITLANGGTIILASTPRGKQNAMWELYMAAQQLDDWRIIKHPTEGPDGTNHIDPIELAKEKAQMDPGTFEQEFNVSFEKGIEGQIFGRQLDKMNLDGRITHVPWLPDHQVNCVMDIGVNDATAILFYQIVDNGNTVRIIDSYTNNGVGLDHYIKIIKEKPYAYNPDGMFAPHDMQVREFGSGAMPRVVKAAELGINFEVLKPVNFQDSLNNAWFHSPKMWIDNKNCKSFIAALENYRREWFEDRQDYSDKPVHNWASHFSDCYRYLCQTLDLLKRSTGLEEFERQKAKALYGNENWQLKKFNLNR